MKEYIKDQIKKSYETKQAIYQNEALLDAIAAVARECVALYKTDKKTILAGNGGSGFFVGFIQCYTLSRDGRYSIQ